MPVTPEAEAAAGGSGGFGIGAKATAPDGAIELILRAALFAADKHRTQKRKDYEASPYINHPLAVARTLACVGQVTDPSVICAALLHDTVEDTDTTFEEIEEHFGLKVTSVVREVTDDKALTKEERKRVQVEKASFKSPEAKLVKLADKISNFQDILACPPAEWTRERKLAYFEWGARVVEGLRGSNPALEHEFDRLLVLGTREFGEVAD